MHVQKDEHRLRLQGQEHSRSNLDGGELQMEGHAPELEDHNVERGWHVRK